MYTFEIIIENSWSIVCVVLWDLYEMYLSYTQYDKCIIIYTNIILQCFKLHNLKKSRSHSDTWRAFILSNIWKMRSAEWRTHFHLQYYTYSGTLILLRDIASRVTFDIWIVLLEMEQYGKIWIITKSSWSAGHIGVHSVSLPTVWSFHIKNLS